MALVVPQLVRCLGVGRTLVDRCVLLNVYGGAGFDSLVRPVVYISHLEEE